MQQEIIEKALFNFRNAKQIRKTSDETVYLRYVRELGMATKHKNKTDGYLITGYRHCYSKSRYMPM